MKKRSIFNNSEEKEIDGVAIVDGGAGGLSTASNIRKYDKDADTKVITVISAWHIFPAQYPMLCAGKWNALMI